MKKINLKNIYKDKSAALSAWPGIRKGRGSFQCGT